MHHNYNPFEKTELKIKDIRLNDTNLHLIAEVVADLFEADRDKVLVIDVRNEEVALDILDPDISPRSYVGKEKELLSRLAEVPGVELGEEASVTSDGMLGWIAFDSDPNEIAESIDRAEEMSDIIAANIARRVLIYPSGTEVINGEIEDTNTPLLIEKLTEAGFSPESGQTLKDDENDIVRGLVDGINHGFGTIITTGGVGAEDKDHSVESVLRMDPNAAAPYIVKFEQGHGRHLKDGVRIAVGQVDHVRIVTLPGPNDEVAACVPRLIQGLTNNEPNDSLANGLAEVLRNRWKEKMLYHKHQH